MIHTEQIKKNDTTPSSSADTSSLTQSTVITPPAETNQHLFLSNPFITHHPKSGLNPLVDTAAYLFSIVGKLKQLKTYRHLNKLQKELTTEMNTFQDAAKARGYSSEYLLVSRYALCATLDDIISNTAWGGQGQWENYNLLTTLNQDIPHQNKDRFFVILERIVQDPTRYIDLMEFMYLCLSLGFKGSYRATEFGQYQLEQITHSLYKHIRSMRGDFSKTLSPLPKKTHPPKIQNKPLSLWIVVMLTTAIVMVLFIGLGQMLDTISNQAYQELMRIGKSILYEKNS